MTGGIHLTLLGNPGGLISLEFPTRKVLGRVAYLALQGATPTAA